MHCSLCVQREEAEIPLALSLAFCSSLDWKDVFERTPGPFFCKKGNKGRAARPSSHTASGKLALR